LLRLQISQMFKPEKDDVEYAQGRYMLQMLGLQVRRCPHTFHVVCFGCPGLIALVLGA
jgi:hypothetical protein